MTANPTNQNFENGKAAGEREDYAQAKEFFETAIEEGCIPAMTYLASMLELGLGVEVDPQKTLELLYKAADGDDADAYNRLGYFHAVGKFVEQNFGAAVEYHKLAAKQGHVLSQYDLGLHYARGMGVQQNISEAQRWFTLAAEAGYPPAQHSLAGALLTFQNPNRDTTAGMKWMEVAAAGGNVQAQYEIGNLKLGLVFPELLDFEGAAYWLELAAKNGSVDAICQIGNCYEHGVSVDQDYQKAANSYFEAVKLGSTEAAFALGTLFENGLGVPQDYEAALKFYGLAAEHFHVSALYNRGRFYQFGWGVPVDYSIAHRHFLMAAERGHVMCQFLVGQALLRGVEGTPINLEEGASWMKRAADAGFDEAQAHLGLCYLAGHGVSQNYYEALRWSLAAAEKGNAWAQYRAAYIIIRHGPGRESDFVEAVKWLVRSYNQPQEDDEKRHELIKDDFKFIQSSLPPEVFEAACRDAESGELQRSQSQFGGHA